MPLAEGNSSMINVARSDLPPLAEYLREIRALWKSHMLTNNGSLAVEFEEKVRRRLNARHFVLMNNGTSAIEIALSALGVKGEVVTTPFTFIATTNAIIRTGGTPVFADIDSRTFNVDPARIEEKINARTSAILAVHVYGNPCDVRRLESIADAHDIPIIFDSAHAFGVTVGGRSIFAYGDASTLSFHATKVLNSAEGGGVVVRSSRVARTLRLMRNHGIVSEDKAVLAGTNAKMTEFQAALGILNLRQLGRSIASRRRLSKVYRNQLAGMEIGFQKIVATSYNYAYMPVCLPNRKSRDYVYDDLRRHQINARKYFYPLTSSFAHVRATTSTKLDNEDVPIARDVSSRILCLPLYPTLTDQEVVGICRRVHQVLN